MRWRLVGSRWQEVWRFRRGLGMVRWEVRCRGRIRVRWFRRSHRTEITAFVARRTGCIRLVARVISGNTAVVRLISCIRPISSEPGSLVVRSVRRALPRMLMHLRRLLLLLRHRYAGVLRAIRTSKWREGTSTSIARMVMV